MLSLFDTNRNYVLGDPELDLIGDRDKLAQWRHKNMGPAFYRLGRKIIYRGMDFGPVTLSCRSNCSFRPPCVRKPRGFSSRGLSDGGAGYMFHP